MSEFERFQTELRLRGFSPMTVRNYSFFVQKFIAHAAKQPSDLSDEDARSYLSSLIENKSKSTTMLAAAAIKFFFTQVLKKPIDAIHVPKKDRKLPEVLTKEEVKLLINAADTTKSRLMLSFLYSSGLRVSELVKLKPQDMRFEEKIGWVRSGKGGKDRMFILSEQLGKELQDYT
ncbi:MAG: phage integrase N-terminal SAM-like domain-containing protein, partial [Nanoarchaeota archaeon]